MIKIELIPDLSHCIETIAKKEFDRAAIDLVSSEEASDTLKEKIKILRSFLSTADFKKLRAESEPFLVEGCTVIFTLCSEDNSIKHTMTVVNGKSKALNGASENTVIYGKPALIICGRNK